MPALLTTTSNCTFLPLISSTNCPMLSSEAISNFLQTTLSPPSQVFHRVCASVGYSRLVA